MEVVGLEEHFVTRAVRDAWLALPAGAQGPAVEPSSEGETGRRLLQLGEERLTAMDDSLERADLTDADQEQIASGNWDRLFARIRRDKSDDTGSTAP